VKRPLGTLLDTDEVEVLAGRRAFPMTQQLLAGAIRSRMPAPIETDWHDTGLHPETGAFALVREDGGLDDLIGEIVKVTYGRRSVFVYVLASAQTVSSLSLARRAYFALLPLSKTPRKMLVEIVA
jgi:hypothetical protein